MWTFLCSGDVHTGSDSCELGGFEIQSVLGQGFFGGKYTDKFSKDNPRALQIIKGIKGEEDPEKKRTFKKEINAVAKWSFHLNIIKIYGFCSSIDQTSILMEYATITVEGERLSNLYMYLIYLRKKFESGTWQGILKNDELHSFLVQIAMGMMFLEEKKIVHGDLMTRNILINDDRVLKISNFDFTKANQIQDDQQDLSKFISRRWAAPEVLFQRKHSNHSDVWSFAVVIWEIGTLGGFPFPKLTDDKVMIEILNARMRTAFIRPEVECNFNSKLYKIMARCWSKLGERPNFETLDNKLTNDFKCEKSFKDFNTLGTKLRLAPTIDAYEEKYTMKNRIDIAQFTQYKTLIYLGSGDFGQVDLIYSYKEILGHKTMVLRSAELDDSKDPEGIIMFKIKEKIDLENVEEHENLAQILGIGIIENKVSILTEYVALNTEDSVVGNLYDYLLKLRKDFNEEVVTQYEGQLRQVIYPESLNHKDLGSFALQIAKGMSYLESLNIGHGNLSAKNVLMSHYKTVKISDYGLSFTKFAKIKVSGEFRFWAAPEVLEDGDYTIKSDVWTFGIVLWEIATLGERPKFGCLVNDLQHCDETFYDFKRIPADHIFPPTKEEVQKDLKKTDKNRTVPVSIRSKPAEKPTHQRNFPASLNPPLASKAENQFPYAYCAKVLRSALERPEPIRLPTSSAYQFNEHSTARAAKSTSNLPPS